MRGQRNQSIRVGKSVHQETIHIVTDSVMGAADYAQNLMNEQGVPVQTIGTVDKLLKLPDGSKILVYQINGNQFPAFGVCETARGMIERGNFVGVVL